MIEKCSAADKKRRSVLLKRGGQTLIEVVVTIGVALVIIGSLVTLINASNRRSTLARQATQASKLAQEGMEIVRHIRDVDAPGAVKIGLGPNGLCTATPCSFDDLYTAIQSSINPLSGQLQKPSTCSLTNSYCLIGGTETVSLGGANYTRVVTIIDNTNPICADLSNLTYASIKKITVSVTWDSPIGSQERKVESCLGRKD